MKIFSGSPGYAGFYGPNPTGTDVTLMIARASNANYSKDALANQGFLADTYQIQWGRSINVRRVFNNNKPIAVVGFGQGTITLQGLLGTYEGFENIVGANDTSANEDLCDPLTITISGASTYNACEDKGEVNSTTTQGPEFKLTGCLLSNINITGQIETNTGALLQQATAVFSIGGFEMLRRNND